MSDFCKTWIANGKCDSCYDGYDLSSGECVLRKQQLPVQPQPGTGPSAIPGCAQVQNGVCVKCAFRYYAANGLCRAVNDLCKSWNDNNGACTDCYDGYELSSGECVLRKQQLPVQPQPGTGPSAIPGCAQVQDGVCVKCAYRYYAANGLCRAVSDMCKSWNDNNGACTDCYDGYDLSYGECVLRKQQLPVQPQPGTGPSAIPGCAQVQNGVCVKCAFRYYAANGVCRAVSDLCRSWNDNNGACTDCYDGYELSSGECVLRKQQLPVQPQPGTGPSAIPGCAQVQNGVCVKCAFRYYAANGVCRAVNDLCKSWNDNNGACTDCYDGYELSSGECVLRKQQLPVQPQPGTGPSAIPGCAQVQNGVCVKCAFRYYAANGLCRAVSDLCRSWNDNNGACTDCYDGYNLSFGECVLRKQQLPVQPQPGTGPSAIPGCAQVQNGVCVKCAFRYYAANGVCRAVSDLCRSWNDNNGACTDCYDGYSLISGCCELSRGVVNTNKI